ncbi:hypothetical protein D3C87_583570 [compost metagenome]
MCLEFFENFETVQTTFHSANQLMDERNGMIPLPSRADLLHPSNTLVELYETIDKYDMPSGILQKVLIRVHHLDTNKDYAYVVARDGFLISAWANDKNDIHRLERRDVYFSNFLKEDIEIPDILKDIDESEE